MLDDSIVSWLNRPCIPVNKTDDYSMSY